MITLQEIQEQWEDDCKLDELNLGQESTKIPELHSKYLNIILSTFQHTYEMPSKDHLNTFEHNSEIHLFFVVVFE